MGWLFLLAFFLVGLPLLAPMVDVIIALVRWVRGKPVIADENDSVPVSTRGTRCCPSCMYVAKDAAAPYCSRCGTVLMTDYQDYVDRDSGVSRTRLFIVAMAGAVLVAALFAAFNFGRAAQVVSPLIDPNHPPTISFGTSSAPAPNDNDKGVKWEIRLQRK